MNKKTRLHCHYLMALGYAGLGNKEKAKLHSKEAGKPGMDNLYIL
jgi:hypothetical protein